MRAANESYALKMNIIVILGFSTEYYNKPEFAFKNIEGKSSEELDKNSDGNNPRSDGDTDIDNDDYINTDE